MNFGNYLEAGKPVIALVGKTKVGKTTIARELERCTGGQLWHARDFYRGVIVPEFYKRTNARPSSGMTFRDETVAAADWWYAQYPDMFVRLMREHVEVEREPFILESVRVKGDVEALARYAGVSFVVVEADDETRVRRLVSASDNIDGVVTQENALERIRFNDGHYRVGEAVAYAKSLPRSYAMSTSGLDDSLPDNLGRVLSKLFN